MEVLALFNRGDQGADILWFNHLPRNDGPAEPRQDWAPDRRTDDRHQAELREVHPNQPGWERNQVADHRQQAREKDPAQLVTLQPSFGALEFRFVNEKIPAEARDHHPTEPKRHPITGGRAQPRAKCPRRDHAVNIQLSFRREKRRRRNHQLAGDRKDRAFHRHEQDNSDVAPVLDPAKPDFKKVMHRQNWDFRLQISDLAWSQGKRRGLVQSEIGNLQS